MKVAKLNDTTDHVDSLLNAVGTTYFDLANSIQQSPYHLLNAKLGMEYKKTALSFWAKNLAGTKYISYGYDFGAVHLGDPAIFGTSFSYKF
jgi:iron complex outermembrane receptor protein